MTEQEFGVGLFKKDLQEKLRESKWEENYLSNRELAEVIYSSFFLEDVKNIITELKKLCKNQEQV
jgi:hypothetical protein